MIKVVFLGTSSGVPTRERNLPSIFLMYENERILFDCGEGTQRQLMSEKLKFMKINRIFISHWHADHFAGLLGLVQTMSLENRAEPLYVYGPRRTAEFVDRLLGVGYFARSFKVVAKDVDEGEEIKGTGFKVIPFRVEHRVPALGYVFKEDDRIRADMEEAAKFGLKTGPKIGALKAGKSVAINGKTVKPEDIIKTEPGKKIVYTGDTKYNENIVKFSKDADLLIADSTFGEEFVERAGDFRHSTSNDAAEAAKKAGVKQLVLTHISRRYQESEGNISPKTLEDSARKIFKNTILARDFLEIEVK